MRRRRRGRNPAVIGLLVLVVAVLGTLFAFTKQLPFTQHYEINAIAQTANLLHKGSLVRIAGVNVGTVSAVEAVDPGPTGTGAARITLRIADKGRPIHTDATLKIRPRIFLEGNFFVDLSPGTPEAPELADGGTLPIQATTAPVQIDQVLGTFQGDTRAQLKVLLHELALSGSGGGAEAINRTQKYLEPAYKNSALVNDATLGVLNHDLSGYIRGAGRAAEGLDRNGRQLQGLIGDLRITAGAFAARDQALTAAIGELPRTLRVGQPALAALNGALPSVRRFVADLRPGVRSTPAALDVQLPFITQLRAAVGPPELRGLAADLRPTVPALASMNASTIPLLEQLRALSSCQTNVVLPWGNDRIQDSAFPSTGPVFQEQGKALVGLAGESRSFDANGQWFRVSVNQGQFATPVGGDRFMLTDRPLQSVNPPKPAARPPLRSDVPCETQQPPDLRTSPQAAPSGSFRVREAPAAAQNKAQETAVQWLRGALKAEGQNNVKVSDSLLTQAEVPALKVPGAKRAGG